MIRNYLIAAFRRLDKKRVFTFINLFGLSIGITAFILMALYLQSELSYDRFHSNADRIVRVTTFKQTPEASFNRAESALPVGPALQADFPEVKEATRIMKTEALMRHEQTQNRETEIAFADNNVFNVFQFHVVNGSLQNALKAPFEIVITQPIAMRYFATTEAAGKTLQLDEHEYHVTAVVEAMPANSHFSFDAFLSMETATMKDSGYDWLFTNWYSDACYTYLLLDRPESITKIGSELSSFEHRHKQSNDETIFNYSLEKLTDIYLKSKLDNQIGKTGSMTNVLVFSAIAFFILVIAAVNYINLATAQSADRSREVGLRKVVGASKFQLRWQSIIETLIITLSSTIVALGICQIILPLFNQFAGKQLHLPVNVYTLSFSCLFVITMSLMAGYYPAFIISNFKPAQALRGKVENASSGMIRLRELLVIFQFSISSLLIVCCLVVYSQLNYINSVDVGFNRSQTIVVNTYGDRQIQSHLEAFKQELKSINGVKQVSASSQVPGDEKSGWSMEFKINGQSVKTEMPVIIIDHDFLKSYEIPVLAGRDLNVAVAADSVESMVISESAVHELGFQDNEKALGTVVEMYPTPGKIVGVFRDFNYESLHTPIAPLAMRMVRGQLRKLSIRVNSADIPGTVQSIEQKWKKFVPNKPFEFSFAEDDFNNKYQSENKFGQVFIGFAILAITISCIGLYGISLITAYTKKKEIGIRKIVGASTSSLVVLLTKGYIRLVIISLLVAFPVAYYGMNQWLTLFSYRTQIGLNEFVIATVISLTIALATVIAQTLKTSNTSPVEALKQQ